MTNTTVLHPPPTIERGLRSLCAIAACSVEDGPKFDEQTKQWTVTFSIRRSTGARFVGATTRWCALIDASYPFGDVAIHPATEGGMTATFPHQSRNTPSTTRRPWREGKLCLDSPFGSERRLTAVRDPVGDADSRLRWHVERATHWLERAANDQLLAIGDPFELPATPPRMTVRRWERHRVVHDESTSTFESWRGCEGTFGTLLLGAVPDIGNAIGTGRFAAKNDETVREWTGRKLGNIDDLVGFWWLLRQPLVLPPWEMPATWGQLRRAAKAQGLDVDGVLRWLLPSVRGARKSTFLLIGYPIASRVGEPASEVHWNTLVLPRVPAATGQPRGFRPTPNGFWHRDRTESFADKVTLQYLPTENWSPERLQARGRLPSKVRDLRIAVLGLGALGSTLAEMLVRAGVKDIGLLDNDVLAAGNVCRHTATLGEVGKPKVTFVGQRLRQISPALRVTEFPEDLPTSQSTLVEKLDDFDVVIDCTSSDEVLMLLARAWWSIPRVFASFSMGFAGKRLFSFGSSGHQFRHSEFTERLRPWLEHEAAAWTASDEVLEGAGCWSPLFPARYDDVVMASAVCVKELETLVEQRPTEPRFRVFAQSSLEEGFQGFLPERTPPALEALAS